MLEHESLKIVNGPDENNIVLFIFVKGLETEAADYLLSQLTTRSEIMLRNDKDDEGEGATTIKVEEERYSYQEGGHGWQGEWKFIEKNQVKSMIIELAQHNLGGHRECEATFVLTRK